MAIRTQAISSSGAEAVWLSHRHQISRRGGSLPLLVALGGAIAVCVGSYMTWATFYAGLISRNGVAGHGKYFIGLAVGSMLVAVLSNLPGVSRALRLAVVPGGATIAFFAIRDLRRLDTLVNDPSAGF